MDLPFYTPVEQRSPTALFQDNAEKYAGHSVSGHGPQPVPVNQCHHSLKQPITRMGQTVQHIIQCQATGTVTWLYNLLPHVSPWWHFVLRPQRKTNVLHTHEPQYNDGSWDQQQRDAQPQQCLQLPPVKQLLNLPLQHLNYQSMIQKLTWCPNQHTSDFIKSAISKLFPQMTYAFSPSTSMSKFLTHLGLVSFHPPSKFVKLTCLGARVSQFVHSYPWLV